MDAFSEIVSGVKLNGALFFNAEFTAPWGVAAPSSTDLAHSLAPDAAHLLIYHFVLDGFAYAQVNGPPLPLEPGDIVVVPHGHPHIVSSEPHPTSLRESSEVARKVVAHDLSLLRTGGGGRATRFVCGYMACEPHLSRPVLSGLPVIFKVNIRNDKAGCWLENSILHLVEEAASGTIGSQAMLAKLSEALFVATLRRFVSNMPEQQSGWLSAARDPLVGRSLTLLHSRVDYPWTLATLAAEVGISRSTLVERFTRYLSEPPMTYLTRWRLQSAARTLAGTSKGVAEIASTVGYESEAAFNRAFKREFGLPPARYRREKKSA